MCEFAETGMEVVLHEDKKYYPTHEEVYGEEVEVTLFYFVLGSLKEFLLIYRGVTARANKTRESNVRYRF